MELGEKKKSSMYYKFMVFKIRRGAILLSLTLCLSEIITFPPLTPVLNSDICVVKTSF